MGNDSPITTRQHRLRRHPARGPALRYLSGFHSRLGQVVLRQLQVADRTEFRVAVVGMLDQVSLLTECPVQHGLPLLNNGDRIEVRLFSVRDLVIFQSTVLMVSTLPAPYLHLSWPEELCVLQVRTSSRIAVDKPATFGWQVDGEMQTISGSLVDLSPQGAAFLCDGLGARPGDQGELVLMLEVDPKLPPVYVHPPCVVRSVREPLYEGGCLQYGLEFIDISLHDTLAIRAFLGTHEMRAPRN